MKKMIILGIVGLGLLGATYLSASMKINDETCYLLAFDTIAFDSMHLHGKYLNLSDDDTLYFKEEGRIVGFVNKVGHILIEAPEEKCLDKKPDLGRLLKAK